MKIKPLINISRQGEGTDTKEFWSSKSPRERLEAVETIREHHYSMLGYHEPPRMKKTFKLIRIG